MSAAAEAAHEKWFAQHALDCASHFVVGAKVYRTRFSRIEEGVVRRVSRCKITSGGSTEECDGGEYPYYVAEFGRDWEGQTHAWKFFWVKNDATKVLLTEVRSRIEAKRREICELEALVTTLDIDLKAAGEGKRDDP